MRSNLLKVGLAITLGACLAVTSLAAADPLNISVFSIENFSVPPADNKIYKMIEDKLGVTFTWDIAVGEKDQKIGTLIASGDYPDLLNIDSPKFIDAGAVIPLEGLIEKYAPNLKKHYAAVWDRLREKDGHIYCLPNYGVFDGKQSSNYYSASALWIQKAVLKEFNYPKITTVAEYFDIIAKYKAKHPTTADGKPTIGFGIVTYDWHSFALINPPNFLAGYPNNGNGIVDPKTNTYKVFLGADISKKWFKILNDMNQKGLVDKEAFVDNYDQYLAKLANGQILGIHDQAWQFQDATNSLIAQGKIWQTMAPLPIVFDKNTKPWYRDIPIPNLQRGYGISIKAKDPVRIIKFLNDQLSEDWQKIFNWGIKGEDYSVDAKGVPFYSDEQQKHQDDTTWKLHNKAELWFYDAPKSEGTFSDGFATAINDIPSNYFKTLKPADQEVLKAYKVNSYADLMDPNPRPNPVYYPAWQISPPDGSDAKLAWDKATQVYKKDLPKIILAKPADFEKLWAAYLDDLKASNIAAYEAYVQQGILDRIKMWSAPK